MPDGTRYDEDFFLWTRDQARRLRSIAAAGSNVELDWDHLAEEIESVGNSERREIRSRLETVIEHLLKLQHSPALEPRNGWIDTVRRERRRIELVLEDSPSLRRELPELVRKAYEGGVLDAVAALERHGESGAALVAKGSSDDMIIERVLDAEFIPGLL
jgi:hypothetical protein